MMLRGLWKLTWIEIKVFLREPLGAFGTIGFPVLVFFVLGRVVNFKVGPPSLPVGAHVPLFSFATALIISTWSILSIGFLIASIVPTARFAQPIGAIILYPVIAVSGLFVPVESLPPLLHTMVRILPSTYAVRLLQGIWNGDGWVAHLSDLAALTVLFLLYTAISARVFRWE